MEMSSYDSGAFHTPIEPMVIINSQDEEEDRFFLKLQLCRKSTLAKLKTQISQVDQFRNHLEFLRQEVCLNSPGSIRSENSIYQNGSRYPENDILPIEAPEITIYSVKKRPKPSFKIKLFRHKGSDEQPTIYNKDCKARRQKKIVCAKNTSTKAPVRLIPKDEVTAEPYAKRKSSPLDKCPICKKYFRRMKTHLLKHEIMQNQDICAGLICEICNKAFNSHSNLQIHMRTHTGDKPYVCEVCNKSFSQSCNLINHVRIHTGEKPFKCPHCDRAFTQSGNLNNHIRLHTDEKPFKCHFCDKAFVQSGNLNSHIRNNHKLRKNKGGEVTV